MGMVAAQRRIGSAFFVHYGRRGDVRRFAQTAGVSRQWIYREAHRVTALLDGTPTRPQVELERCQAENAELRQRVAHLEQRLAVAVVLDDEKQSECACVAQAAGVTLTQCRALLDVLIPGQALSVATLGRRTQAVGKKAGALLKVLDAYARPLVREGAGDEIYVKDPVLMVVEQESLCWVCGQLSPQVSGAAWAEQLAELPNLEQFARDGGKGLAKGVAVANEQRQAQEQKPIVDQGDHFHALRTGNRGLPKAQKRASQALAEAETAQRAVDQCNRQGRSPTGATVRARHAWNRAEQAMDRWQATERVWQRTKEALRLITPAGELNTRAQAEAVLAETLPLLPDDDFAKTKRQLQWVRLALLHVEAARIHGKQAKCHAWTPRSIDDCRD